MLRGAPLFAPSGLRYRHSRQDIDIACSVNKPTASTAVATVVCFFAGRWQISGRWKVFKRYRPTCRYISLPATLTHFSRGFRLVPPRHNAMRSGVLGVQHVDVASGRARELRERPQVVLPGNRPSPLSPFFVFVYRCPALSWMCFVSHTATVYAYMLVVLSEQRASGWRHPPAVDPNHLQVAVTGTLSPLSPLSACSQTDFADAEPHKRPQGGAIRQWYSPVRLRHEAGHLHHVSAHPQDVGDRVAPAAPGQLSLAAPHAHQQPASFLGGRRGAIGEGGVWRHAAHRVLSVPIVQVSPVTQRWRPLGISEA